MAEALPLTGLRLLIVEDEAIVAMMLKEMLSDLGCVVLGMAGTVSRGLAMVGNETLHLEAAVLDVNLGGEKVYPVAEMLTARNVPFIFSSGYGAAGIEPDYAGVPTVAKPFDSRALETTLLSALAERGGR